MSKELEMAKEVARVFRDYNIRLEQALEIVKEIYGVDVSES